MSLVENLKKESEQTIFILWVFPLYLEITENILKILFHTIYLVKFSEANVARGVDRKTNKFSLRKFTSRCTQMLTYIIENLHRCIIMKVLKKILTN